ncbi:hypothetical protein MTO96_038601 [Rhipicephalus appendiculatus]
MDKLNRVFVKELGGSVLLTLGNYCASLVFQVFGAERPVKISACGDLTPQGTDTADAVAIEFSGGRLATFALSSVVKLPEQRSLAEKARSPSIRRSHAATCVESPAGKFEIQLPPTSVPHNFPNTSGLRYQAEEERRCLREGLLESPTMTHHD